METVLKTNLEPSAYLTPAYYLTLASGTDRKYGILEDFDLY